MLRTWLINLSLFAAAAAGLGTAAPLIGGNEPGASGYLSNPIEIYRRSVHELADQPRIALMSYTLRVDADHLNITRSYDRSGEATTTLHFGGGHEQSTYRVFFRGRDIRSMMKDTDTSAVTVGPPIPWSLDFRTQRGQSASGAAIAAGAVTTDAVSRLLNELTADYSSFYRITLTGIEQIGNRPAYELSLANLAGDPNAHPLRGLIVDASTFRPCEVLIEVSHHQMLFGGSLRLRAKFAAIGPYWLNTEGVIEGRGHYAFMHVTGTYAYSASDFSFPLAMPNRYFAER